MRKLRLKMVKQISQDQIADTWQSQGSSWGQADSKPVCVCVYVCVCVCFPSDTPALSALRTWGPEGVLTLHRCSKTHGNWIEEHLPCSHHLYWFQISFRSTMSQNCLLCFETKGLIHCHFYTIGTSINDSFLALQLQRKRGLSLGHQ